MGPRRIVIDTNVMVRGINNARSPSGQVLALCDQRLAIPLLNRAVMREYRRVLSDAELVERYPELSPEKVERVLARLAYIGQVIRQSRVRFAFPRDPKDAMFIELAIAGAGQTIVTSDRDLLDLPSGRDETARRFRQRLPLFEVMRPEEFVRRIERDWVPAN